MLKIIPLGQVEEPKGSYQYSKQEAILLGAEKAAMEIMGRWETGMVISESQRDQLISLALSYARDYYMMEKADIRDYIVDIDSRTVEVGAIWEKRIELYWDGSFVVLKGPIKLKVTTYKEKVINGEYTTEGCPYDEATIEIPAGQTHRFENHEPSDWPEGECVGQNVYLELIDTLS